MITKCPTKWILIDEETGQVYRGSENKEVGKMWELISQAKVIILPNIDEPILIILLPSSMAIS